MGIGSKLTILMKQQNTNANELAAKSGVPAQTIYSLIRRDAKKVEIDSLIKIAKALNVTVEYFGDNYSYNEPTTLAAHFDGDEYTEEELEEIRNFAKYVKNKNKN